MTSGQLLRIGVVGHTNVGKTSLMRTLTRKADFGDVSASPGTTRIVQSASIRAGEGAIEFFDTPGLEDSSGVLAHLKEEIESGQDWIEAIAALSARKSDDTHFAQEGKALRQVIASDLLIYVIDARDQVRAKHRDELEILMRCGRPILAVLNFVAESRAGEDSWRETLARTNIHAVAPFDTVVYSEAGEIALYEKARTLLDAFAPLIEARLSDMTKVREGQRRAAVRLIAQLAVDLGALEETASMSSDREQEEKSEALKNEARRREGKCQERLLKTYGFDSGIYDPEALPLEAGLWEADPFDPDALARFGFNTTAAAATGAAIGLGVDLIVGGVTLGAAAATGAIVGGGIDMVRRYGQALRNRLAGQALIKMKPEAIALMLARQMALLRALLSRGHGAQADIVDLPVKALAELLLPIADKALKSRLRDGALAQAEDAILALSISGPAAP